MSKAKKPDHIPTNPNKTDVWDIVRGEITTDMYNALAKARKQLEGDEDSSVLTRSHRIVSLLLDLGNDFLSLPLFDMDAGRPRWDVYLEGVRGLLRDFRTSFLLSTIFPLFKLNDVGGKTASLDEEALKLLHSGQVVLNDLDVYVQSRAFAQVLLRSYGQNENGLLGKAYAVAKTWEEEEKFEGFSRVLEQMLDQSVTVIIEGPIQLYLMLSKTEIIFIFKALSSRVADDRELGDRQLSAALALHEEVQEKLRKSEIRECCLKLLRLMFKSYHESWVSKHKETRSLFPTEDMRRKFLERFEHGTIFLAKE